MATHPTDFILSHAKEAVKQRFGYDAQTRMAITWVALANAKHGDPCLRTDYLYDGTSTRVLGMKESLSTWDAAWDF